MENVCWLHWSQQALPKGSFWALPHWSSNRLDCWLHPPLFPRLLLGLSLDRPQGGRLDQDSIHHPFWGLCLHDNALRTIECWSNISKSNPAMFCRPPPSERWNLRGQCGGQHQNAWLVYLWSGRNLQQLAKIWMEAQPYKVCLWRTFWKITRFHH